MAIYNVNKIENWHDDFLACKNKFNNNYYSDYKNSYLRVCNDRVTRKMSDKLSNYYSKLSKAYTNIEKRWNLFLSDLIDIDEVLAGNKSRGVIKATPVITALNSLPDLTVYKSSFDRFNEQVGAIWASAKSWIEENLTFDKIMDFFKRSGATVVTGVTSAVEGVVKLGEMAVDLVTIAGAAVGTTVTGLMDFGSWVHNKIIGEDRYSTTLTERVWVGTRAMVSEDHTGSLFDKIYEDTPAGQWLKNTSYGFETTRAIGKEVGEVVGVVALSALTGGGAAVMYGAAKTAEHTETNWQDENLSTLEGFTKGVIQGASDGAFFALGMKADAVARTAAKNVAGAGFKASLKKSGILGTKMLFEAGTAVGQDIGTIATDAVFLKDSFVDANGNTVRLNGLSEKLKYSYEQAGGASGLLTSAGTAFVLSAVADRTDVFGKIKTGSAATTATGYLSSAKSKLKTASGSIDDAMSSSRIKNAASAVKNNIDVKAKNFKGRISDTIADASNKFKNIGSKISDKSVKLAGDAKTRFSGIKNKTTGLTDKVNGLNIVKKTKSAVDSAKNSVSVKVGDTKVKLENLNSGLRDKLFIRNASSDVKYSVLDYSNNMERLKSDMIKDFPEFRNQLSFKEDMQLAKDTLLITKNTKLNLGNYDEGIDAVQKKVHSLYGDFDKKISSLSGDNAKIKAYTERYHNILNDFDSSTNSIRDKIRKANVPDINQNLTSEQIKDIFSVSDDFKNASNNTGFREAMDSYQAKFKDLAASASGEDALEVFRRKASALDIDQNLTSSQIKNIFSASDATPNNTGFREAMDSYQAKFKDLAANEPTDDALEAFRRSAKNIMDSDVVSNNAIGAKNAKIIDLTSKVKNGLEDVTNGRGIAGLYDEIITDANGNVITTIKNGARDATNDSSSGIKNIFNAEPIGIGKSQMEDVYSYSSDAVRRRDEQIIYIYNKLDELKNYKIPASAKKTAAAVGVTVGLGAIISKINNLNVNNSSINETGNGSQTNSNSESKKPVYNEKDMEDVSDSTTEETTSNITSSTTENKKPSGNPADDSMVNNVLDNKTSANNESQPPVNEEPVVDNNEQLPPEETTPGGEGELPPEETTPGGEGELPPEETTPGGEGELPPEETTPGGEEQLPPEETTPGGEGELPPEETTPGGEGELPPEETTPGGEGELPPEETTPGGEGVLPPEETTPGGEGELPPEETTPGGEGELPPEGTTPGGEEQLPPDGAVELPPEESIFDNGGDTSIVTDKIKDRISNVFDKISKYFKNIGGRNE